MERFKKSFKIGAVGFAILILFIPVAYAQNLNRADKMKNLIDSKNYIFKADLVLPNGGNSRQLIPGEYTMRLMKDTLTAFLPYFGRIFSASMDTDPGIKFTSTNFLYTIKARKKRLQVIITPNQVKEVSTLILDISDNGSAMLMVNSIDRQPVSFSGYVVDLSDTN